MAFQNQNNRGGPERDFGRRDDENQNRYTTLGGNEGQVRHRGREGDAHYAGGPGFGNYGYGAGGHGYGGLEGRGGQTDFGRDSVGTGQDEYRGQMRDQGAREGRFAGRGPKGWSRADDRVMEDVCQRLTDHADIDASDIEVKVQGGEVTLSGTVDSRHVKRMAEDVVERVSGVKDVHNQLRVKPAAPAEM